MESTTKLYRVFQSKNNPSFSAVVTLLNTYSIKIINKQRQKSIIIIIFKKNPIFVGKNVTYIVTNQVHMLYKHFFQMTYTHLLRQQPAWLLINREVHISKRLDKKNNNLLQYYPHLYVFFIPSGTVPYLLTILNSYQEINIWGKQFSLDSVIRIFVGLYGESCYNTCQLSF